MHFVYESWLKINNFGGNGQMIFTLKDVKEQKVTKHLASNNINVIHQQYPS